MFAYNPGMGIQMPNLQEDFLRGQEFAAKRQEWEAQNALRQAQRQYGAAAMEGDQNALRMLAQHDPEYALGLRSTQQQMDLRGKADTRDAEAHKSGLQLDQARLDQIREQSRMAAADHSLKMDEATRARELEETNRVGSAMSIAWKKGPEEFARFMGSEAMKDAPPELRGLTYEDAPYGIAMLGGATEGLQAPDPIQLGANERLIDPTTRETLVGPAQGGDMTAATRSLRERALAGGLVEGTPEFQDFMRNGGVQRTQQVPTEGERKAAGYLGRMEAAEEIIGGLAGQGNDRIGLGERALNAIPFMPESFALSAGSEQLLQAQRDWVRAKLRLESGAVIGDEEMREEIKTYFPQPGDSPEVVAQKAKSRQQAMEQVRTVSGRAVGPEDTAAPPAPAEMPQSAIDAGIDPNLWQYLSPEDQALWN